MITVFSDQGFINSVTRIMPGLCLLYMGPRETFTVLSHPDTATEGRH